MKRPWKEIFDRTYEEERKKVNTFVGVNDFREGIRCKTATCPNKKYVIVSFFLDWLPKNLFGVPFVIIEISC